MRINLLLSHSSLPLLRALPVVLGNRYFENSMISGTSHERTHLHAKRSIYNTAFLVSIELTIRQSWNPRSIEINPELRIGFTCKAGFHMIATKNATNNVLQFMGGSMAERCNHLKTGSSKVDQLFLLRSQRSQRS